jgi:hypothetical protein
VKIKICKVCGRDESETKFYATRRTLTCADCENKARAERTRRDGQYTDKMTPEHRKRYALNAKLKNRFGITLDEYEAKLHKQKGVCAVCKRTPPPNRRLCVDHDHDTGAVRGLVCDLCNRTMGQAGDDPELLIAMARYLRKYKKVSAT